MIKRSVQDRVQKIIDSGSEPNNVIIIEGARQVGKTSLIEQIIANKENSLRLNLEERSDLKLLIDQSSNFEDYQVLLENHLGLMVKEKQVLFIDEAQESFRIGSYIRFMKEKWPHTRVILSGSSMGRLFRKEQRIPVGRFEKYLISPFSYREFLISMGRENMIELIDNFDTKKPLSDLLHREFLSYLDQYIEVGGLPQVVTIYSQKGDWKKVRSSVFNSQIDDFVRKSDFENPQDLLNALRAVASNLGFPSKYVHLNEDTRIAKRLVQLLVDWHLIYEIEQRGNASMSSFFPKRYIYDLGIAQLLRNMPFPNLSTIDNSNSILRTQLGGVFENLVLIQLVSNLLEYPLLSGWKKNSHDGVEVDFIIKEPYFMPIEVKASNHIGLNNFKSIIAYLKLSNLKVGMIISNDNLKIFRREELVLINLPIYLAEKDLISRVVDMLL